MTSEPKTPHLELRLAVRPLEGVQHSLGTTVATAAAALTDQLYSKSLAGRLDVILSELVNNVLEHRKDRQGLLEVRLHLDAENLEVRVTSEATAADAEEVKSHVREIQRARDAKTLLGTTIQRRRAQGGRGGLGLIRLASETKARLNVQYDRGRSALHVSARVPLEEDQL